MNTLSASSTPSSFRIPRLRAPQAFSGMRMQMGAEVESTMYARRSREMRKRSKRGRDTAPATSTVMFDSMKITMPMIHARNWARRPSVTHRLPSIQRTNPRTPPAASSVAIIAPITRVNRITFAFPGSPSTATVCSIAVARPTSGFQPSRMVQPIQMPAASDT